MLGPQITILGKGILDGLQQQASEREKIAYTNCLGIEPRPAGLE